MGDGFREAEDKCLVGRWYGSERALDTDTVVVLSTVEFSSFSVAQGSHVTVSAAAS